ncbi:MAG: hypothetical protein PVG22_03035 [Chromatiales bacterium]|jgi:hypothetical protein
MILRRIYMLFPGRRFADRAVADLVSMGVDQRHIHTIAREGVDITGLPKATVRQRRDLAGHLDQWLWDVNLLLFFFALVLFAIALFSASWGWAVAWLTVMGISFYLGYYFVRHIPHAHMSECRTALRHGEILLLVDVPQWRQAVIEKAMRTQHSEIEIGGIGWTLDGVGI